MSNIIRATVVERSTCLLRRFLDNPNGAAMTANDIQSITCVVYDMDDDNALIEEPEVTVSDSVFALKHWRVHPKGYNFGFWLPPECLPEGGKTYRVEFLITPEEGEVTRLLWELKTENTISE